MPRIAPSARAASIAIIGVLAGCSSSDPPEVPIDAPVRDAGLDAVDAPPDAPDAFDMELPGFRSALCDAIFTCRPDADGTVAECEDDITEDMLGFKALLDDQREQQCTTCMRVTAEQARAYVMSSCDEAVLMDQTAIIAACDLTPDNGMVDTEEACGGSP